MSNDEKFEINVNALGIGLGPTKANENEVR